jgi:hypothetical protein
MNISNRLTRDVNIQVTRLHIYLGNPHSAVTNPVARATCKLLIPECKVRAAGGQLVIQADETLTARLFEQPWTGELPLAVTEWLKSYNANQSSEFEFQMGIPVKFLKNLRG